MKVWLHLIASCFLIGAITLAPVAADEKPEKTNESKEESVEATATNDGSIDVKVIHIGNIDVDGILKRVSESLSKSDLSEAAKQKIIDGVRSGLEVKVKETDGDGAEKNRFTKTFQWKGGVWTDEAGKQHHFDWKANDAVPKMQERIAAEMESKLGALKEQTERRVRVVSELEKQRKYAIGIALKFSEDAKPESDEDAQPVLEEAKPETREATLEVESVFDDSPAAKAGLKPGDILKSIDDTPIQKAADLILRVQDAGKAERAIKLAWTRDGEPLSAEIKPTSQPRSSAIEVAMGLGPDQIYVAPTASNISGFQFQNRTSEVSDLKKQVESLRDEIRELKELILAGQKK